LFCIKELGTAMRYGCNDNIKGVGHLSCPGCNEINVMSLFNTIPRTKRSHGHKRIQHLNSIGRKMFNYKAALQDINIEGYLKNSLTCDCSHSPFQYNPSGHVITGDLNIIQHEPPKGDFSWS
jgi:hypothetical protein